MKDKKLIYIVIIMICLTVILGISYAWFNTIIEENEKELEELKKKTVESIKKLEEENYLLMKF